LLTPECKNLIQLNQFGDMSQAISVVAAAPAVQNSNQYQLATEKVAAAQRSL